MKRPAKRSISQRIRSLSLFLVLSTAMMGMTTTLLFSLRMEYQSMDRNLMNSAQVLAQSPQVAEVLSGRSGNETLTAYLDSTISRVKDIDAIVVADRDGIIRYSPDPSYEGTVYPEYQSLSVLNGESTQVDTGAGVSELEHRALASVTDEEGELLGFVSVGIGVRSVHQTVIDTVACFAILTFLAAGVGLLFSRHLSGAIKDSLMGYEPDVFRKLFHQREDILDALEEGILAIDGDQTIIFLNTSAAEMLSLDRGEVLGRPLHQAYPNSTLDRILRTGQPEYNVSMSSLKEIRVLADRLPLYDDGKLAGAVSIFRNRTELTRMADDLTGVRHMVDAMRAYTHEFLNKLHVILGLLQIGEPEKAQQYIMDTSQTHREAVGRIMSQIHQPSVAALLVGKTSRANELGIRLVLDRESSLRENSPWLPPDAYVTILGNLIENAIEILNQSRSSTKEISVSIRESEENLLLCVEDTGPGIPPALRQTMFQRGATSKGRGRGTGLALVQEIAEAYHGEIRVESESGVGTSFFLSFCRESSPESKE